MTLNLQTINKKYGGLLQGDDSTGVNYATPYVPSQSGDDNRLWLGAANLLGGLGTKLLGNPGLLSGLAGAGGKALGSFLFSDEKDSGTPSNILGMTSGLLGSAVPLMTATTLPMIGSGIMATAPALEAGAGLAAGANTGAMMGAGTGISSPASAGLFVPAMGVVGLANILFGQGGLFADDNSEADEARRNWYIQSLGAHKGADQYIYPMYEGDRTPLGPSDARTFFRDPNPTNSQNINELQKGGTAFDRYITYEDITGKEGWTLPYFANGGQEGEVPTIAPMYDPAGIYYASATPVSGQSGYSMYESYVPGQYVQSGIVGADAPELNADPTYTADPDKVFFDASMSTAKPDTGEVIDILRRTVQTSGGGKGIDTQGNPIASLVLGSDSTGKGDGKTRKSDIKPSAAILGLLPSIDENGIWNL